MNSWNMIMWEYDGFDWDLANSTKVMVRVALTEVERLFEQPLIVKRDLRQDYGEVRFIGLGIAEDGRVLMVAFTMRRKAEKNMVRVISARYAHRKERDVYEKIKKAPRE